MQGWRAFLFSFWKLLLVGWLVGWNLHSTASTKDYAG
jgi:hypothetical protein